MCLRQERRGWIHSPIIKCIALPKLWGVHVSKAAFLTFVEITLWIGRVTNAAQSDSLPRKRLNHIVEVYPLLNNLKVGGFQAAMQQLCSLLSKSQIQCSNSLGFQILWYNTETNMPGPSLVLGCDSCNFLSRPHAPKPIETSNPNPGCAVCVLILGVTQTHGNQYAAVYWYPGAKKWTIGHNSPKEFYVLRGKPDII